MNKTFRKSLILLAILLCSCESSQADHTENTSRMESSPASISVSATETATSETAAIYTPMTTEKSHPNQNARMETFENGDVVYQTYLDRLVGMRSNAGQVRIPYAVLSSSSDPEMLHCSKLFIREPTSDIRETGEMHLPNCTELTVEEGYTEIIWSDSKFDAPLVETVYLPATLTGLMTTLSSDITDISEQAVKMATVRYDADATTLFGDMPMGTWLTSEDFERIQQEAANGGFFTTWRNLKAIHVAPNSKGLYDIAGVLYANANWKMEDLHLLYHPELQEMPTVRLMCVPQNHSAPDGIYSVTEGTQYIHSGGIFHPKNIHTLILPDSLLYLSPTAIIATAEQPLTVVCSPGSAAEKYVTLFGDMYHLMLQVTE